MSRASWPREGLKLLDENTLYTIFRDSLEVREIFHDSENNTNSDNKKILFVDCNEIFIA